MKAMFSSPGHALALEYEEKGVEKGIEKGIEQGRIGILVEQLHDGFIHLKDAAKFLKVTETEFLKRAEELGYALGTESDAVPPESAAFRKQDTSKLQHVSLNPELRAE